MPLVKLISLVLLGLISLTTSAQPVFTGQYPDTLNKGRLRSVVITETVTYATGLAFLSFIWYKDKKRVPFHYYNDSKGYLQMDKAGHAYAAYRESYGAYYALRWAGVDKNKALLYGGPVGLIFQTPIEVFDGMYEGWGFSWSDMIANAAGPSLFIAQELLFDKQIALMKFSYAPSPYAEMHNHLGATHLQRFFYDYNGHTYWLSAGLQDLTGIQKIPPWLNLAVGYSANGMIYEFRNPTWYNGKPFPYLPRYRQYLLSLDVNFSQIPVKNNFLKKVFRAINLVKIPFPALEYNAIDGLRMNAMYF